MAKAKASKRKKQTPNPSVIYFRDLTKGMKKAFNTLKAFEDVDQTPMFEKMLMEYYENHYPDFFLRVEKAEKKGENE